MLLQLYGPLVLGYVAIKRSNKATREFQGYIRNIFVNYYVNSVTHEHETFTLQYYSNNVDNAATFTAINILFQSGF